MSIESGMPSSHLFLCHPFLLLPSIFPSISSVQFSHSVVSNSFQLHELQHIRPPCPSPGHQLVMPSNHLILCHPLLLLPSIFPSISSVQFSHSVMSNSLRTMNRSTPGLPVHHHLPEFTQTHVHRVPDAIKPSHLLSSPSPPAPNPSQHQSFPMSQLFA